jgi:hypothetical protein
MSTLMALSFAVHFCLVSPYGAQHNTMKMEAVGSSETLVNTSGIPRYINPEDQHTKVFCLFKLLSFTSTGWTIG